MKVGRTESPRLELTRGTSVITSVVLDSVVTGSRSRASVSELQRCGLTLRSPEDGVEYSIRIGDLVPMGSGNRAGSVDLSIGRRFGDQVFWEDEAYFESARGETRVFVLARERGVALPWSVRGEFVIDVVPTKVGEERYQSMFESLRQLAQGLVYDLLAKSTRALGAGTELSGGLSTRSSQLELHALGRVCARLEGQLRHINRDPVRELRRKKGRRLCWGSERVDARAVVDMVQRGSDPRARSTTWPIPLLCDDLQESMDTVEHRVIVGFLRFLVSRIRDCKDDARLHIEAIEADRRFLDINVSDGPTLYETMYVPRIERLQQAQVSASRLESRIRRLLKSGCLADSRPDYMLRNTPVFENVVPYRKVWATMCRYSETAMVFLDEGAEERVKATSRMYEQWVFFQIAAAIRSAGLHCEDAHGLLRRRSRRRFTLDLDRDTRLTFRAPDGRAISIRYEPWIAGVDDARARRDTVYRGRGGERAWSPDVLIEVLARVSEEGESPLLEYAVVVDAKYSHRIGDRHWDGVQKYLQIRATATGKQIVKQVWIAHPDSEEAIALRDPTLRWTVLGPDASIDEHLLGTVGLLPPVEIEPGHSGGIMQPSETATEFVVGLLTQLGLLEGVVSSR